MQKRCQTGGVGAPPVSTGMHRYATAGLLVTWVLTCRLVTLSGPSPDNARVTWSASRGLAEVDSARPIADVPASHEGRISVTSAMTCALAWQDRSAAATDVVSSTGIPGSGR